MWWLFFYTFEPMVEFETLNEHCHGDFCVLVKTSQIFGKFPFVQHQIALRALLKGFLPGRLNISF